MGRLKATDAEILEYLRKKAEELGRPPKTEECRDGPLHPSSMARRFGGWKAALRAAGIGIDAGRDAKRRAVLERLRAVAAELGRAPRLKDWQGPPSRGAVASLFGGWAAALRAAGIEPDPRQRRVGGDIEAARREILQRLRALAAELGRAPRMRDWHGPVSSFTVARLFTSWRGALEAAGIQPDPRQRKPAAHGERRAAAVERLRSLAQELGRTPRMADWRGPFGVCAVLKCFGTWNAALEAAGLEPNRRMLRPVGKRMSDEEILESLRRLAAELGRRPSATDLLAPAAVRLGCPTVHTVRQRFGSFRAALEAAGLSGLSGRAELRLHERESAAREAARRAEELASLGFVLADEAPDPLVRRELRKRGVPILAARGSAAGSLRAVLDWLRGRPARGVLPSREEIREAMGERAFSFLERWAGGAALGEIGRGEGLTRERARQIMAEGARRAAARLVSAGRRRGARPRPLLPRDKIRPALRALLAAAGARDPASLAAAVAELEDAVHGLRRAANSLALLGPEGAAGREQP